MSEATREGTDSWERLQAQTMMQSKLFDRINERLSEVLIHDRAGEEKDVTSTGID